MYKCHACGRQFQGGDRIDSLALLREYVHGKQTYTQLAEKYGCSARTIQRHLDKAQPGERKKGQTVANVVMDTTYFSDIGVMVFKNSLDGTILHMRIVDRETVRGYCLDGHFSDLKNKLRNHNGMSRKRKVKMILEYFSS